MGRDLLIDPVVQEFYVGTHPRDREGYGAEIWLKPQVMDPVGDSVKRGVQDMGLPAPSLVRCGTRIYFYGEIFKTGLERALQRLLVNPVIHQWKIFPL
ncbi:MAG: phosphoribosylformylglycinamidine synthase subunit PurS [Elusimicrobia bacterium]|nr:phosphoribosylformylglycinamidine synthase subunit PurS [Elusimicrobiota bacterium]